MAKLAFGALIVIVAAGVVAIIIALLKQILTRNQKTTKNKTK